LWKDFPQFAGHRPAIAVHVTRPGALEVVTLLASVSRYSDSSCLRRDGFAWALAGSPSATYTLLRETLRQTKKVGVARFAIRTRGHVGIVGVRDKAPRHPASGVMRTKTLVNCARRCKS
jgi:hypothetical protein